MSIHLSTLFSLYNTYRNAKDKLSDENEPRLINFLDNILPWQWTVKLGISDIPLGSLSFNDKNYSSREDHQSFLSMMTTKIQPRDSIILQKSKSFVNLYHSLAQLLKEDLKEQIALLDIKSQNATHVTEWYTPAPSGPCMRNESRGYACYNCEEGCPSSQIPLRMGPDLNARMVAKSESNKLSQYILTLADNLTILQKPTEELTRGKSVPRNNTEVTKQSAELPKQFSHPIGNVTSALQAIQPTQAHVEYGMIRDSNQAMPTLNHFELKTVHLPNFQYS